MVVDVRAMMRARVAAVVVVVGLPAGRREAVEGVEVAAGEAEGEAETVGGLYGALAARGRAEYWAVMDNVWVEVGGEEGEEADLGFVEGVVRVIVEGLRRG